MVVEQAAGFDTRCTAAQPPPPYREVPAGGNHTRLTKDGVDIMPEGYAWLDKEKPCGERGAALSLSQCRTILPGQGFDRLNLPDWELEIRKA